MHLNVFNFLILTLALAITTGCTSRIAAGRIVAAPNRTPSSLNQKLTKGIELKKFLPQSHTNSLSFVTVSVGPPAATLKAVVLSPQDYGMRVVSKYWESTNRYGMSFQIIPATNSFTPLEKPATIVLLHGYSMTKESLVPWGFILAQAGYRVVLVDLRGHGKSTGWQVSYGKNEVSDFRQMLDALIARELCDERVGVLGLSYGATLGLHWAARDARVQTVVAIAPYNQPDEAMIRLAKEFNLPLSQKTMQQATKRASTILKLNWTDWSGESAIRQLKIPIMLISAEKDSICLPNEVAALEKLAPEGSCKIEVGKANHLVVGYWFHELQEPVVQWFHQRLRPKSP